MSSTFLAPEEVNLRNKTNVIDLCVTSTLCHTVLSDMKSVSWIFMLYEHIRYDYMFNQHSVMDLYVTKTHCDGFICYI